MCKDKNDSNSKQSGEKTDAPVNPGRHRSQRTICRHAHCREIKESWIARGRKDRITKNFAVSRYNIYRHARACNLFAKRQAKFKIIYEKILKQVDLKIFTGLNIVSALHAYVKIISAEKEAQTVRPSADKTSQPNTTQQREALIPDGSLADLVQEAVNDIPRRSRGAREE